MKRADKRKVYQMNLNPVEKFSKAISFGAPLHFTPLLVKPKVPVIAAYEPQSNEFYAFFNEIAARRPQ